MRSFPRAIRSILMRFICADSGRYASSWGICVILTLERKKQKTRWHWIVALVCDMRLACSHNNDCRRRPGQKFITWNECHPFIRLEAVTNTNKLSPLRQIVRCTDLCFENRDNLSRFMLRKQWKLGIQHSRGFRRKKLPKKPRPPLSASTTGP